MSTLYDITITNKDGREQPLSDYRGKVLLVVNTASKCGFTPQFDELEDLNKRYHDKGLVILGFPCNQFGAQDPGSQEEIESFCKLNFGVTFPVMRKIDVNGESAAPLFNYLKKTAPGILGSKKIKWNFTKFLISADGQTIERYAPSTKPSKIARDIEMMLNDVETA
ncbi:glutathione peroxidase [Paremcibacter congregatus]|uniref:glutathione peroxidase n=1 Tax=Paremcibacter congregatus TaxID=2043170 RepID=UPI0030EF4E47|tara:strand:- start:981 stop:1478 length:498 start_codon:yes stop_codon:yes gene_type:complete